MKTRFSLSVLVGALLVAGALPAMADSSLPSGEILAALAVLVWAVVSTPLWLPLVLGIWRLVRRPVGTTDPVLAGFNLLVMPGIWLLAVIVTRNYDIYESECILFLILSAGYGALASALLIRRTDRRTLALGLLSLTTAVLWVALALSNPQSGAFAGLLGSVVFGFLA